MKNKINLIISAFICVLLFAPRAQALDIYGAGGAYGLDSGSQPIGEVTVIMDNLQYPITAANGLGFVISEPQWVLWDKNVTVAQITGNAAETGKMAAETIIRYSDDLKILRLPILADWSAGDKMTIAGLKIRVYNRSSGPQPVGVDLDGDNIKDYDSKIYIRVNENDQRTDTTPPYQPVVTSASVLESPWRVKITWNKPLDYDFTGFDLSKVRTDGNEDYFFTSDGDTEYVDENVHEGETPLYRLYAVDRRGNRSEPVMFTVTVQKQADAGPDNQPQTGTESEQPTTSTGEIFSPVKQEAEMTREIQNDAEKLLPYYRTRYLLKCRPGASGRSGFSAACLWAKIDLVYAQMQLGYSKVKASFTKRELSMIRKKLPLSERRLQVNCQNTPKPAPFCSGLASAIQRVKYLLTH